MSPEQLAKDARRHRYAYRSPVAHTKDATVVVVGLGYVGLPLAILCATRGHETIGFDIDEVKIAQLERREAAFLDEEEAERFQRASKLTTTSDESLLDSASVYMICVPTPVHHNHTPDLSPLENASETVGRHLKKGDLVIIESTVNPGACEEVALPILERASTLSRDDFYFAHCPERINPGDTKWDVRSIPRVIGALDPESLERAVEVYRSILDADVVRMGSIKEAEAVKMVENSFRDINIAFVNELAIAFDKAGIDIVNVIKGASTKPFGFLPHYPGAGVGGHCIPVDPYYLIRYGRNNGFEHRFLMTARRINNGMPAYTVSILEEELRAKRKSLRGAPVTLLGLSYKKDISDMRESPALVIRDALKKAGAIVRTYDPYILSHSDVRTLKDALEGAEGIVIATDHASFRSLSPRQFEEYGIHVVVDGRNCLDKEAFKDSSVTYRGIGRK